MKRVNKKRLKRLNAILEHHMAPHGNIRENLRRRRFR